jgi:hypothetical protein
MKHINKKIRLAGGMPTRREVARAGYGGTYNRSNANEQIPWPPNHPSHSAGDAPKKNKKGNAKGPEIIPPVYLPPQLGEHQYGASHSYAETIDLITDGPIEGLVNQNGLILDGGNILQGIYLNDTPVAVTDNSVVEGYHDLGSLSDPTGGLAFADTKLVSGFFTSLEGAPQLGGRWQPSHPQSICNWGVRWPSPRSNYMRLRNDIGSYKLFTHTNNGSWPVERTTSPIYTAPTIRGGRSPIAGQTIGMYTDDYTDYGGSDVSDAKFVFAFGNKKKWANSWGGNPSAASGGRGHFYWTAWALVRASEKGHPKCNLSANLVDVYNLYTQTDNPLQKELAKRVLNRLGSEYPESNSDFVKGLTWDILNANARNCHIILRPDSTQNGLTGMNIVSAQNLMNYTFRFVNSEGKNVFSGIDGVKVYDFLCPEIDTDGVLTGTVKGFIMVQFQWEVNAKGSNTKIGAGSSDWGRAAGIPTAINDALASISDVIYMRNLDADGNALPKNIKYNYSNVLAEFRRGTEEQMPLKFFNKIFIDHIFNTALYGPYRTDNRPVQSVAANTNMLSLNYASSIGVDAAGLPINEGSEDTRGRGRGRYDYANWAKDSLPQFAEAPLPVTHVVLNPNVDSVFVTLMVGQLHDTLHTQKRSVRNAKEGKLEPGASFPSILNVAVTTGLIDANGKKSPHKTHNYRIVALIESSTLIDIGNPDGLEDAFSYVTALDGESLVTPIPLPKINKDTFKAHSDANQNQSMVITADKHIATQRYVEVEKLSTETNSILISKSVDLQKVTEIIPINLTYPFSTMVGTKLDSRSFGAIPVRSFDCKLKQVKVPSNYEPLLTNGVDKRYYLTQEEFDDRPKHYKRVYHGDWDGTFSEDLQWTDNPAWILYDLLTSTRYGLGHHINEEKINKWQLYEIGRFCDAVDENGFFVGVPDGHGGREPRFACSIVFDAGNKIYDALNAIVGLFRGSIFFNNGEINFTDDRPRETVDLFTNDSVKDGMFHYANNRRDQIYNTIEVTYLDRFDSYVPKIEVVEDEEDIRQRGVFKKKIEAIGITSRAMARRAAEHQIFSLTKENQTLAFEAGLETLLCEPGDLIIVEDELKTLQENFGKILEVNVAGSDSAAQQGTIRLSNKFVDAEMTGRLTVYVPTGRDTISEVEAVANRNRQRSVGFTITGDVLPSASQPWFSGEYNFSGYIPGYSYATGQYVPTASQASGAFEEYALYTGTGIGVNMNILYFSTGFTGWVFATGTGDVNSANDTENFFIASGTGSTLYDLGTGFMNNYDTNEADARGESYWASVSGLFSGNNILDSITRGFLPSEVLLTSPSQTTVLNVTGQITLKDYGCLVSGFDKPEFLPLLKLGSACKFEIKNASPFIYKVRGIREINPNQFLVSASKYETGKWDLIENNVSIEYKENTFAYNVAQTIGNVTYSTLDPPKWTGLTTGDGTDDDTFFISGDFTDPNGGPAIAVSDATGFNAVLIGPGVYEEKVTTTQNNNDPPKAGFCVKFDNLDAIGNYTLNVNALGNQGATDGLEANFNSSYDQTGLFVLFEENLAFGRSSSEGITVE